MLGTSPRVVAEALHQLSRLGDTASMAALLCQADRWASQLAPELRYDLFRYWRQIKQSQADFEATFLAAIGAAATAEAALQELGMPTAIFLEEVASYARAEQLLKVCISAARDPTLAASFKARLAYLYRILGRYAVGTSDPLGRLRALRAGFTHWPRHQRYPGP